ncbi:cadmium-induced protein AS8 isoform X1 [Aristolochia californica]|uniref:cadmium-induced protein AS8 isoform X1 n=1 Tax=Aristolochia californica TaxID=171875 RepID=UPI0035D6AEFB
MIIKGLFRRYERWNPVHPTYGAFWGMGLGIGCGVGWGPGFGPEVIGYVGAGCGVGFSVGITLAGIGIGLPANFLYQIPYNVLAGARNYALEFTRSTTLPSMKNATRYGWTQVGPNIAGIRNEAIGGFSNLKMDLFQRVEFPELKKNLSSHAKSSLERMISLRDQFFPPTQD